MSGDGNTDENTDHITALEAQIFQLTAKLHELRKANPPSPVPDYTFDTQSGQTSLLELFGDRDRLMLIHNMGQGCRWCTLWADGFNGFLPHLESTLSVVLVSKDAPETQRRFANSRGWRFRLASHGGGDYIREQSAQAGVDNMPGVVVYERKGKVIMRKNSAIFGPGDLYCSLWHLLALAGVDEGEFTPQFNYWQRPTQLDDGGANVLD
jgi:predicted dithiol-disulfide oxidoreductase (DUF899 family)